MNGDKAHSRARISNDAFRSGYDRIFRKKVDRCQASWRFDKNCPDCAKKGDFDGGMVFEDSFGLCCAVCGWFNNYKEDL